jgi:hypothetical protein
MPARAEFAPVFTALKTILTEYEPKLKLVKDTAHWYYLDTHTIGPNKRPIMFAAIRIGKNYVSYYFMPIYAGMSKDMSPELKKRMQGKACFNFTAVDAKLFTELRALTKKGYAQWKKLEWVD